MAVTKIQQYCPVSDVELANGRALSSRVTTDWARQLNNMKSYACAPMLIPNNTYPAGTLTPTAGTVAERYFAKWCAVPFPSPYSGIRVVVCGRVYNAGDEVTLKMYADKRLYNAANPVVTSNMTSYAVSGSTVFTSTTNVVQAFSVTGFTANNYLLDGYDWAERDVYLMMSATNTASQDMMYIINIAAWALAL